MSVMLRSECDAIGINTGQTGPLSVHVTYLSISVTYKSEYEAEV